MASPAAVYGAKTFGSCFKVDGCEFRHREEFIALRQSIRLRCWVYAQHGIVININKDQV